LIKTLENLEKPTIVDFANAIDDERLLAFSRENWLGTPIDRETWKLDYDNAL